jgi:hypothetical protein
LTDGFGRTYANVVLLRCRTGASRKIDLVGTQWTVSEAYEAEWLQVTV